MKRLGTRVNLIPVIAKADTMTLEDLANFKLQVGLHFGSADGRSGRSSPPRTSASMSRPSTRRTKAQQSTPGKRSSPCRSPSLAARKM